MSQIVGQISEKQDRLGALLSSHVPDPLEWMLKTSIQTAGPGQYLLMETDETNSVIVVLHGWLSLSKSLPNGEVQIVDFALPGEIIEAGVAEGSVSSVSVEALTDVSVAVVPALAWDGMKRHRPDLTRISRDIRAAARARTAERMLRLGRGNATMRMSYALLELYIRLEAIGQARAGKFQLPMNQRMLGDFVGLSSVHVCRTLGQMVDSGTVRVGGHMNVEILELDRLTDMAGVDLNILRSGILADVDHMSPMSTCPARA
ncbi:MAG TPA: Crp/Fnr family transcriptional regulator [Roseovarius sp.]